MTILRAGGSATVSGAAFTGMSPAAATYLESIRTGLSTELLITNRFIPGVTPLSTNPAATGVGWLVSEQYGDPPLVPDDADATYGKNVTLRVPDGVYLPIASVVRGNPTQVTITGDTADLSSNFHYTNCPGGGPFYQIKNWFGDGTATLLFSDTVTGTIVNATRIDLAVDSTGWAASPASGVAKLGFSGGSGNHSLATVPSAQGQTAFGDVWYFYVRMKVPLDYQTPDGSGGTKNAEISWHPQAFMNFCAPGYGTGGGAGNDTGPLSLHHDQYAVSRYDGTVKDPPESGFATTTTDPLTRGTYVTTEIVFLHPAARAQDAVQKTFANGVAIAQHTVRVADYPYSTPITEPAWRAMALNIATTVGGGGTMPAVGEQHSFAEVLCATGVARSGAQADHLHATCEEGDTPPNAPFHIVLELRDANDARLDAYTDLWNPGSGRQKLALSATAGASCAIVATTSSSFFAGDGLGRVRVQVTPAGTGAVTVSASLAQTANNDKLTGVTYAGSKTVTVT